MQPRRTSWKSDWFWSILGPPNSLWWYLTDSTISSVSAGFGIRHWMGKEMNASVTLSPKLFSGACLETALEGCPPCRQRVDVASFRPLLIRVTVCGDEEAWELIWCLMNNQLPSIIVITNLVQLEAIIINAISSRATKRTTEIWIDLRGLAVIYMIVRSRIPLCW